MLAILHCQKRRFARNDLRQRRFIRAHTRQRAKGIERFHLADPVHPASKGDAVFLSPAVERQAAIKIPGQEAHQRQIEHKILAHLPGADNAVERADPFAGVGELALHFAQIAALERSKKAS